MRYTEKKDTPGVQVVRLDLVFEVVCFFVCSRRDRRRDRAVTSAGRTLLADSEQWKAPLVSLFFSSPLADHLSLVHGSLPRSVMKVQQVERARFCNNKAILLVITGRLMSTWLSFTNRWEWTLDADVEKNEEAADTVEPDGPRRVVIEVGLRARMRELKKIEERMKRVRKMSAGKISTSRNQTNEIVLSQP